MDRTSLDKGIDLEDITSDIQDVNSSHDQSFDSNIPLTSTPLREGSHTGLHSVNLSNTSPMAPSFSYIEESSSADPLEPSVPSPGNHSPKVNTPSGDHSPEVNTPPEVIPHPIRCYGIKVVGDNVNVTVDPRNMRSDHQACQLDYFQMYAVRDRIDISGFSEESPLVNPDTPVHELLPTAEDNMNMLSNIGILVARVLVKHIPSFSTAFSDVVMEHIPHIYSKEMSTKSEIVSSSILC